MYRPSIFTSHLSSQSSRIDIPNLQVDPIIIKDTDDPSMLTNQEIREKALFERKDREKKKARQKYLPGERLLKKIGKMKKKENHLEIDEDPDLENNLEIDDILKSFKL